MSKQETTVDIRVRYAETDAMGVLHHAQYAVYFELARTELLREQGGSYRDMERGGYFLVVAEMSFKFRRPAHYDDLLSVTVRPVTVSPVKLIHEYEVRRGDELLTEGRTILACVDSRGHVQRMPDDLVKMAQGDC